jgi:hypothetical protein
LDDGARQSILRANREPSLGSFRWPRHRQPVDDTPLNPPSNPALLNALAQGGAAKFNLKTFRTILRSRLPIERRTE